MRTVAFGIILFLGCAIGGLAQTPSSIPSPTDPPLPSCASAAFDSKVDIATLQARHDDSRVLALWEKQADSMTRCLPRYDARLISQRQEALYLAASLWAQAADLAVKRGNASRARRDATSSNILFERLKKDMAANPQWTGPAVTQAIDAEIMANDDLLATLPRARTPQSP